MSQILDPGLLDAIEALECEAFEGNVWRVTWATRDPLAGGSGGGRWTPSNQFEALYTSLHEDGALAEIYYHLSRAPVFASSNMLINTVSVSLNKVLRVSEDDLRNVGLEDPMASKIPYKASQSIGAAAYLLDHQAIIVPSARWNCDNLVLFLDKFDVGECLEVRECREVNWPAWREANDYRGRTRD
jgi:hypothetical protein|tara:strand:+ start:4164 stop:4721 length:558 start_codon:yes stop_codon:yes gene_type:complete